MALPPPLALQFVTVRYDMDTHWMAWYDPMSVHFMHYDCVCVCVLARN